MAKKVGVYELGIILGEGSFGSVRKALHSETKDIVALKIIEKEKVKREDLLNHLKTEIQVLMMVDHPNVVKLIEVLASRSKIYLVLEYIPGGELWDLIRQKGKFDEDAARKIFRQIIRAIDYCKKKNICHRDLKPENILLDEFQNVKISDFGLSALHRDKTNYTNVLHTTCGTIHYLAPEIIQNVGYDGHLADVWSCGVILYFMMAGFLPFEDTNVAVLLDKIVQANIEFPKHFSRGLKDFLSNVINPNVKKRFTTEDVMKHPWFLEKISAEEKKILEEDILKFTKSPETTSKVDAFFSNLDQETDDTSPELRKTKLDTDNPKHSQVSLIQGQQSSPHAPINPRKINAFELSNLLCGSLMGRFCDQKIGKTELGKSERLTSLENFTSERSSEEIVRAVIAAFENVGCACIKRIEPLDGYKIEAEFMRGKVLSIIFELFELKQNLHLLIFRKGQGTLQEYLNTVPKLSTHITNLKINH